MLTSGAGSEKEQPHYRCHPTVGTPSMFRKEVSPVVLMSLQMTLPSCLVATKEAVPQALMQAALSLLTKTGENPEHYRKQPVLEWSSRWPQGLGHLCEGSWLGEVCLPSLSLDGVAPVQA